MKIFLDLRTIRKKMTGVGTGALLLLKALIQHGSSHEFHCLFLKDQQPDEPYPANFFPMETDADYERHPSGEWWLNFTLPDILKRLKIDILHGASFLIPWRKTPFRKVVTIHDMISYRYPEGYPFAFRNYIKAAIRFSARFADKIIVSSRHAKEDIHKILNVPEDKISVAPLYALPLYGRLTFDEIAKQRIAHGLPENFILNVGTLEQRKNQSALITAFEIFKRRTNAPHKLILIGGEGYQSGRILAEKERSCFSAEIYHFKRKTIQELAFCYASADLFVFPSYYEGFGLPILEAMACGAPVIATEASSIPEVAGEAGVYYSPCDSAENLAEKMIELLSNPQKLANYRKKSMERASLFSCEKTARLLLNCYENL